MITQILIDMSDKHLHTFNHSWGNMMTPKPLKLRLSGLNTKRCPADNRDFSGFFIACLARAGEALHMIPGSRGILPTDECLMNHGTVALCKRLLKTGKWLTLAVGSRYERLIIELHRSANNSIPGGYMVNRKGVGQPLRGSCTSNER